jgi:hypothetical protein
VGYDRNLLRDAVIIHEVDMRPGQGSTEDPAVTVRWGGSSQGDPAGGAFSDPRHGITVSVDKPAADGFTLTVRLGRAGVAGSDNSDANGSSVVAHALGAGGVLWAGMEPPGTRSAFAVGRGGRQHTVWIDVDASPSNTMRYASREPGAPWEATETIGAGAGAMAVVSIATGPTGFVYAARSQLVEGRWQVRFAMRAADTGEWTRPEVISPDSAGDAWAPSIAAGSRGRVYVLWQSRYPCGGILSMSDLLLRARSDDGNWQHVERVDAGPTLVLVQASRLVVDAADILYAEWQEWDQEGMKSYLAVRPAGDAFPGSWHIARDLAADAVPAAS